MLDKKSKQVLKALNKAKNDTDYVDGSKALLPYLPKNFNNSEVDKTLWYLESKGFIDCYNSEGSIDCINVKYEAQNYIEFNHIKTKEFIYKSILVPIFVSIFTSCIVYLLTTYCFKN